MPRYLESSCCRDEIKGFAARHGVAAERVFLVEIAPTDRGSWPAPVRDMSTRCFWAQAFDGPATMPLGWPAPDPAGDRAATERCPTSSARPGSCRSWTAPAARATAGGGDPGSAGIPRESSQTPAGAAMNAVATPSIREAIGLAPIMSQADRDKARGVFGSPCGGTPPLRGRLRRIE